MPQHPDAASEEPVPGWYRPASRVFRALIWIVLLGVLGACGVLFGVYGGLAAREDISRVGKMPERSIVYDWKKREIGRLHGENRILVAKADVSNFFIDALLAREDSRFYHHDGVDWKGVLRATARNLKDREMTQGASTLTMQLARVSFEIREKTLHRKLLEAMLARRIEHEYDKNEILIHYMNRVYFGSGIYGVERAAQAYFGKSARELSLGEAAMLAGIIRGPNRFSPFRHPELAHLERDTVLGRMLAHGFVTPEEAEAAKTGRETVRDPLLVIASRQTYAMDVVRRDLELILAQEETEEGGLRIHTSLDLDLQQEAERSLEARLAEVEARPGYEHPTRAAYLLRAADGEAPEPDYLQGAVFVTDNASGGIRAVVGGRNFGESQFNRATQARRQIGSLFKPFVYAKAYERGLFPGTWISDDPIRPGEISWTPGHWSPANSDQTFRGPQPAEFGLVKSRNTMSVRVGEIAGYDAVAETVLKAGLDLPEERSPQLYIGNLGGTLQAITSSYAAFANDGVRMRPHVITAVEDARGQTLWRQVTPRVRVLPASVSWLAARDLENVMGAGGTGAAARAQGFTAPAGGKTGTTNNYNDAWFVGFTQELTCGVWVGLDQQKQIMDRGYGSTLALPVWTDVMLASERCGYASKPFASALSLNRAELCRTTGQLANRACRNGQHAYTLDVPTDLVPRETCREHGLLHLARPKDSPREGGGWFGKIRGLFPQ